jgi:hypothetical protein
MSELTVRARLLRLASAWGIAALAAVGTIFPWSFVLPLFPAGLFGLPRSAGLCCNDGPDAPLYAALGWLLYIPLSLALLVIPDKRISVRLLLILCTLLGLNVAGCYVTLSEY